MLLLLKLFGQRILERRMQYVLQFVRVEIAALMLKNRCYFHQRQG